LLGSNGAIFTICLLPQISNFRRAPAPYGVSEDARCALSVFLASGGAAMSKAQAFAAGPAWLIFLFPTPKKHAQLTEELARDLEAQDYTSLWDTSLLPGDKFPDEAAV
jgi:hypothetical protein